MAIRGNRWHASLLAIAIAALLVAASAQGPYPFAVTDSLGPFLRFGSVDKGTYQISVLVAAKSPDVSKCLKIVFTPATAAGSATIGAVASDVIDNYDGYYFLRWKVPIKMGSKETAVKYQVSVAAGCSVTLAPQTTGTYTFHVPASNQEWNWAYYSCNGFHNATVQPLDGTGIQALWTDLMTQHGSKKFHLAAGNGDQLYNDPYFDSSPVIQGLVMGSNSNFDQVAAFSWDANPALKKARDDWWFSSYAHHWMLDSDDYRVALASIPFTMSWDDHDSFNGFNSQPDKVRATDIYKGLAATSTRFYLLFQQHSSPAYMMDDLAWNGASGEAQHVISQLGPSVAIFSPDLRTERTARTVMAPSSYAKIAAKLQLLPTTVKHLIVLNPQPMAASFNRPLQAVLDSLSAQGWKTWPDVQDAWLQITNQGPIKAAFSAAGFDIRPQFATIDLTDVIDQWDEAHHEDERGQLLTMLQTWAQPRSARLTMISGDSHIAYANIFYSAALPGQQPVAKEADPNWMYNAVSSAIGNKPSGTLARFMDVTSVDWDEPIVGTQNTQVKAALPFLTTFGLPRKALYTASTRNWLIVSPPAKDYTMQLTWRLEGADRFDANATNDNAPVVATSVTIPAVSGAGSALEADLLGARKKSLRGVDSLLDRP